MKCIFSIAHLRPPLLVAYLLLVLQVYYQLVSLWERILQPTSVGCSQDQLVGHGRSVSENAGVLLQENTERVELEG